MEAMFHESTGRKRRKSNRGDIADSGEELFVQISEEHWTNFSDILELLEPLKKVSDKLSGDTYPSLNLVVPAYTIILNHLENLPHPVIFPQCILKAVLCKMRQRLRLPS